MLYYIRPSKGRYNLESEELFMKSKKLLVMGLCSVLSLGLLGFTYAADAQTPDTSTNTPAISSVEETSRDIFFRDTDGGQISIDGTNWQSQSDYNKSYPTPQVEWWTADEYEAWITEQQKELEALIGTGDGWYDGQGTFHEWTQESVNAIIDEYQKTLENIKGGTLYSKGTINGDSLSVTPPTEDVVSNYSADIIKENGSSFQIGNYSSKEELDQAIDKAVENGELTEAEAAAAYYQ